MRPAASAATPFGPMLPNDAGPASTPPIENDRSKRRSSGTSPPALSTISTPAESLRSTRTRSDGPAVHASTSSRLRVSSRFQRCARMVASSWLGGVGLRVARRAGRGPGAGRRIPPRRPIAQGRRRRLRRCRRRDHDAASAAGLDAGGLHDPRRRPRDPQRRADRRRDQPVRRAVGPANAEPRGRAPGSRTARLDRGLPPRQYFHRTIITRPRALRVIEDRDACWPSMPTTPPPRVAGPAGAGREAAPATARLPLPPTSFIGRERELSALHSLLGSTRLLTLTGIGGSGKTRLALELAAHARAARGDAVAWLELASIDDAKRVPA